METFSSFWPIEGDLAMIVPDRQIAICRSGGDPVLVDLATLLPNEFKFEWAPLSLQNQCKIEWSPLVAPEICFVS